MADGGTGSHVSEASNSPALDWAKLPPLVVSEATQVKQEDTGAEEKARLAKGKREAVERCVSSSGKGANNSRHLLDDYVQDMKKRKVKNRKQLPEASVKRLQLLEKKTSKLLFDKGK